MSLVQINGSSLTGKKYWRSLDQLADKPEFRDWVHREFPENATEMLDAGSRRTMLKWMAASIGLAGLTACRKPVQRILPNAKGIEDYIPGKAYFYATAMPMGGSVQGLLVETHDGRPTKIEGNPEHPYSLGAATSFQQASILNLYDPDRLQSVMAEGKASTWDEYVKFAKERWAQQGAGDKFRILSETITSPTLAAQKKALLAQMPKAKWIEYEPVNRDNAAAGIMLAFGQPLLAHPQFDKADVIVALDSDFLGLDSPTVLPVKQFTRGRRPDIGEPALPGQKAEAPAEESGTMNRLYAVEANYTITGAMADHRLRMRVCDVKAFATELAGALGAAAALNVVNAGDKRGKFLNAVAKDLKAHQGKALVIAGPKQPAEVHALVAIINQSLGAPISYTKLESYTPHVTALTELAGEISRGAVDTLVILGGNPAYTSPANLDLAAKLKQIPMTVYLGPDENETAAVTKWVIPEAHYLESWSDGTAPDGTVSIIQPMIEPLYGGKTAAEVISLGKSYDLVRATWLPTLKEAGWREALHNGVVPNTKTAEVKVAADAKKVAAMPAAKPADSGLEIAWYTSSSMYDGRFANNGWMQEAPDTMTKLVWMNAALVSPKTAKDLSLEDGDMVKISVNGKSAEFPVMKQPGHADGSVSISLGYGRSKVGRVGKGVGHDAYALRSTDAYSFTTGATLSKTGTRVGLPTTQHHHSLEGRPLLREASLAEYKKDPKVIEEMAEESKVEPLYGTWNYSQGYQWGMAIDLATCIGCNACMIACQSENNIPVVGMDQVMRGREMAWIRMDRYYQGDENDPEVLYQGVPCMQCENAPCENVCPVAATAHSPEGLNDMAYNRCVGTRYCANNCPYKVRRFNFYNFHKDMTEVEKMGSNPDVTVRMRGIMEKCTYCVQRIQETKIKAKVEGRRQIHDGEIQTACQQTCPADAIVFGNINDPNSRVTKLKKQERNYAMLAELDVRPRTTYLAKLRNPNPELA